MAAAAAKRRKLTRLRLETDERRKQLVDLGLAHFGVRAYDEVSIDDIADAAGISKGLLYHYFPTKRAFYTACVAEAAAQLLDAINRAAKPDAEPLEQLDGAITAYLDYVQAHERAYANLMVSGIGVDEECRAIVDETRAKLIEQLLAGMGENVSLTPTLKIALRGWVGFAETATLAWAEEGCGTRKVSTRKMRDLLKTALLAVIGRSA
jgi:AcrR family transcriptional regulator